MNTTRLLSGSSLKPQVGVTVPRRQQHRTRLTVTNIAAPERKPSSLNTNLLPGSFTTATSDMVFVNENGEKIPVMPVDYGFRSGSGGGRLYYEEPSIPKSAFHMAIDNFKKEYRALRRAIKYTFDNKRVSHTASMDHPGRIQLLGGAIRSAMASMDDFLVEAHVFDDVPLPRDVTDPQLTPEQALILRKLNKLTLDIKGIEKHEHERLAIEGKVEASLPIIAAYKFLCWVLDVIYEGRPIQRFWFLETVARMPYFSYISMLHFYESLGWWRAGAELRTVHFAEEWNELHHLQIMESLGGDQRWLDRFMAQHAAIVYYWLLLVIYFFSPESSYAFSELIEGHAVDTYGQFAEENKELLKTIPPPLVALNYYKAGDLYLFDSFQTGWRGMEPRRPPCNNLYDTFINIRDDEGEHVKTMRSCKDNSIALDLEGIDGMKAAAANVRSLASMDSFFDMGDE